MALINACLFYNKIINQTFLIQFDKCSDNDNFTKFIQLKPYYKLQTFV